MSESVCRHSRPPRHTHTHTHINTHPRTRPVLGAPARVPVPRGAAVLAEVDGPRARPHRHDLPIGADGGGRPGLGARDGARRPGGAGDVVGVDVPVRIRGNCCAPVLLVEGGGV